MNSRLCLRAEKRDDEVVFSLIMQLPDGDSSELFRASVRNGEGKDSAFSDLMYELMRLDALYGIPVSTQIDILYHMVIEEDIEAAI